MNLNLLSHPVRLSECHIYYSSITVANGWESSPRAGCEQLSDTDDLVRKPRPILWGSRHVIINDFKIHKIAAESSSSMSEHKCWILKPAITSAKYGGSARCEHKRAHAARQTCSDVTACLHSERTRISFINASAQFWALDETNGGHSNSQRKHLLLLLAAG